MRRWSEETLVRLRTAGWYPERQVPVEGYVEILVRAGYMPFETAERFLAEFGELVMELLDDTTAYFGVGDYLLERWDGERAYHERLAGETLCYVGECWNGHFDLFMSENGKVCALGDEGVFFRIGNNPEEVMENLWDSNRWVALRDPAIRNEAR